jgi:hypothetical protein
MRRRSALAGVADELAGLPPFRCIITTLVTWCAETTGLEHWTE